MSMFYAGQLDYIFWLNFVADLVTGGLVQTVTGLNTDNTDPANPVVRVSVDGVSVLGAGTPGDPLRAAASGSVVSVTGPDVDNTISHNPVIRSDQGTKALLSQVFG